MITETQTLTSIADCLAFIDALDSSLMKLGMDRIKVVLNYLGNPQDTYKTIHVVGTNGKGSTCVLLESIYRAAGYKTGLFTSPHLVDLRERVQVNRLSLPDADFIAMVNIVWAAMTKSLGPRENWLTYFEFITVLGFVAFQQNKVDVAIIEAGLGGRLDGTNVIKHPEAIVVTSISEDHQAILGETLPEIAAEKAGVFRDGVPVISSEQDLSVLAVLKKHANIQNTQIIIANPTDVLPLGLDNETKRQCFETPIGTVSTSMLGRYQSANIALVLSVINTVKHLPVSTNALQQGVNNAQWPARMQWFDEHYLLIDGSHNKQGINSLLETITTDFADVDIILGLSMLKTKKLDALLPLLKMKNLKRIILIDALPTGEHPYYACDVLAAFLASNIPAINIEVMTLNDFLTFSQFGDCSLKLLTGSLYTAGMALKQLQAL